MKVEILKCSSCNKYTLKKICISCKSECLSPKPARYSVEDKWGRYRRIYKTQQEGTIKNS